MRQKYLILFLLGSFIQFLKAQETTFLTNDDTTQIYISLTIQHQKHIFLFDNAAQKTVLFLPEKSAIKNHAVLSKTMLSDADNAKDTAYIIQSHLSIPELKIQNKKFILLAVPKIPNQLKQNGVSGILGLDVIDSYDWLIDFKACKIYADKKIKNLTTDDYFKLNTCRDKEGIIALPIETNTLKDTFTIDFGHNQCFSSHLKNIHSKWDYLKLSQVYSVNAQGKLDSSYIGSAPIVKLSNALCLQNVPVTYMKASGSNLVGVSFFKVFGKVVLWHSKNQLLLAKKTQHTFTLNDKVIADAKIVAITVPLSEATPSSNFNTWLGRSNTGLAPIKKINLPITLFSEGGACK